MSQHSAIGWTEATWNPVTGCSHVSPGCEHCYAETLSLRMGWSKLPWTNQNAAANVKTHHDRVNQPLSWRTPRRVFVNSMSDMFHPLVPDTFLNECFAVMALAKRHTFQILTKRPDRMKAFMTGAFYQNAWDIPHPPLPNVWLGVSVEDQRRADERIPLLLETPAAVRFVSAEPLLGPVDLYGWINAVIGKTPRLDWVILGGESGPEHRPMQVEWAEDIARDCAGIALFVKQDSGARPGKQGRLSDALWSRKEYPAGRPPGDPTP